MDLNSIPKQEYDINPEMKFQYDFYAVNGSHENINVKASRDVRIALTSEPQLTEPIIEIIIGGWNNTKSLIMRNSTEKTTNQTADILNEHDFRGFWVRWNGSTISVGCKEDPNAFLSWTDPDPFSIQYIGLSDNGSWNRETDPKFKNRNTACSSAAEAAMSAVAAQRRRSPIILCLESCENIQARFEEMSMLLEVTRYIDVETENNLQYKFYPVTEGLVKFKVRAPHDARIALTPDARVAVPITEIIIGGWVNTKSVIRRDGVKPEKAENITNNILNGNEFREFWLSFNSTGDISVGIQGQTNPFLLWNDPNPFPIYKIGLSTGWGAVGSWKIQVPQSYGTWVDATSGNVPSDAVVGGQDNTGELIFVARAHHGGATLPGKLITSHGCAIVACSRLEHRKPEYQVLVGGPYNWVPADGSNLPPGVFPGGESEDGEALLIGRVCHEGSVTTGMVQPSHGTCYIGFGGQSVGFTKYEVLTH